MANVQTFWKKDINGYDPWKTGGDCFFDLEIAENVCQFFPDNFKHSKGEWAGKPFELMPWQKQFIGHLFGWKRADGTRRFRTTLLYIPKKNGKSALGSALGLLLLCADNEAGAEIYSTAGDTEQANIVFSEASNMVHQNKLLNKKISVFKGYKAMKLEATQSYWKVMSSDSRTSHGPNVHGLIIDELHTQRDNRLIEALTAGVVSRRQPLTIYMTTADHAKPSPCNEEHEYASKVRDGIIDDFEYLPCIYEATTEEDWTSIKTWRKANPNFGITLKESYFRSLVKRAKERPSEENKFKRLHLNIQTRTEKRWLEMEDWDSSGSKIKKEELEGRECFAGLDLSSTRDITSLELFFPEEKACLSWFWVPKKTAEQKVEYSMWAKQGYITITEGAVVDYQWIRKEIIEASKKYVIKDIAYDPWNASQLAIQLSEEDGLPMIEFRQGFISMNEPSKAFETLVIKRELVHFGNPVLRWMASNVAIKEDPAGNIKPIKPSKEGRMKVDGIVALTMAIGLSIGKREEEEQNVYNERGLITL